MRGIPGRDSARHQSHDRDHGIPEGCASLRRHPRPLPPRSLPPRGYLSPLIHRRDDKSPGRVSVPSFQTALRPHLGGGPAGEPSNRGLTAPPPPPPPRAFVLLSLLLRPPRADTEPPTHPLPAGGGRLVAWSSSGERAVPFCSVLFRAEPSRTAPHAPGHGQARRGAAPPRGSGHFQLPPAPPSAAARAPLSCARVC